MPWPRPGYVTLIMLRDDEPPGSLMRSRRYAHLEVAQELLRAVDRTMLAEAVLELARGVHLEVPE